MERHRKKFPVQWRRTPSLKSAPCLHLGEVPLYLCTPAAQRVVAACAMVQQSSDDKFSYRANKLPHRHHGTGLPGFLFLLVLFSGDIWINCCNGTFHWMFFRVWELMYWICTQSISRILLPQYLHHLQHVGTWERREKYYNYITKAATYLKVLNRNNLFSFLCVHLDSW